MGEKKINFLFTICWQIYQNLLFCILCNIFRDNVQHKKTFICSKLEYEGEYLLLLLSFRQKKMKFLSLSWASNLFMKDFNYQYSRTLPADGWY